MEVGVAGERRRAEPGAPQLPQAGQASRQERRRSGMSQTASGRRWPAVFFTCVALWPRGTHGTGKEREGGTREMTGVQHWEGY